VANEKTTKITNEISDGTGQFDARFVLWRQFCADNGVPVETLPSALTGEVKEKWEQLKNERLRKSDK
jgi:predicted amidohydrolase